MNRVQVDTFCSLGFAKCYSSTMPITACDLLYERVLPFYDALGVPVSAILTDNGREFCGRADTHPYELLLAIEGIEHRNTKVRSPRTNGFVERMNRTLLDECFRVKGRETFYLSIAEIQRDLDEIMRHYNTERSHQGYRLNGKTPAAALRAALGLYQLPSLDFAAASTKTSTAEQEEAADTVNARTAQRQNARLLGKYSARTGRCRKFRSCSARLEGRKAPWTQPQSLERRVDTDTRKSTQCTSDQVSALFTEPRLYGVGHSRSLFQSFESKRICLLWHRTCVNSVSELDLERSSLLFVLIGEIYEVSKGIRHRGTRPLYPFGLCISSPNYM